MRLGLTLALAIIALISSFASGQTIGSGKTVRKHKVAEANFVAQAEAAIEKKDYDAAEPLLQQALKQDASDYRALFNLGFVYNATGRKPEAIEAYRRSVAANPRIFESTLNLGLMLAQSGDPEAEKYLRAATQLKPTARPEEGLARAWLSLGHLIRQSDPKNAIQAYAEAARLQPRDPEPHLAAAGLLERQNDLTAAEREYRKAAELAPKSSEALAGLVNVYLAARRLPEAEAALRKFLAVDANDSDARVQLGRVLLAQNRPQDAATEFETALKLSPNNAAAQREIADVYHAARRFDAAELRYRQLLEKQPNDAALRHLLGKALLHQRKFADAQAELLQAVQLTPDNGEAYGDLALAASENSNYPLAIKALDVRAKYLPDSPATYFLRATAYDHLRDFKQAAAQYRQFLQVAQGRYPDQEWQARHRLVAIEPKRK